MEEEDEEGAPTPPLAQGIGGVERRGFVTRQQVHTPPAVTTQLDLLQMQQNMCYILINEMEPLMAPLLSFVPPRRMSCTDYF